MRSGRSLSIIEKQKTEKSNDELIFQDDDLSNFEKKIFETEIYLINCDNLEKEEVKINIDEEIVIGKI